MPSRHRTNKPAQDTSVLSAGKLLQTRPFQPEINNNLQSQQQWEEPAALTGGFDLIKIQHNFNPRLISPLAPPLQAKLTIGEPKDRYEQEADRVAKQVVQQLSLGEGDRSTTSTDTPTQPNQTLQRQGGGAVAASDDLEFAIQQSRGGGQPLAESIRAPMEQAFGGVDFSGVKVHTDTQADQLNRSIQAKAFTTGQEIYFQQGAYEPGSRRGQELIAHELAHVGQQKEGLIQRRAIEEEVYKDFDSAKSEQATQKLLHVAQLEDQVIVFVSQAKDGCLELESLKEDKTVGEAAKTQLDLIENKKKLLIVHQTNIGKIIDWLIEQYKKTLSSETYKNYKKTGRKLEVAQAQAAAKRSQSAEFKPNYFEFAEKAKTFHAESEKLSREIQEAVNPIVTKYHQKEAAKTEYGENAKYFKTNKESIVTEANRLKVSSPTNLEELFERGETSAAQEDWLIARDVSKQYKASLTSLKGETDKKQKELTKAEQDYRRNRIEIGNQKKDLYQKSDNLLNYLDSTTQQIKTDIDSLIEEMNNLAGIGNEDWLSAVAKSKVCLQKLKNLEDQLNEIEKFPALSNQTFKVKGKDISKFNVIAIMKSIKEKNSGFSADDVESRINAYCNSIGKYINNENYVKIAADNNASPAELNALTGEYALKEYLTKGKTVAQANLTQEANEKLQQLNTINLTWLINHDQITIGKGKTFLMANLLWIDSAHREYPISGIEGVSADKNQPVIHVHWQEVNGVINKAHVIPDKPTHVNPNPPENDIPDVPGVVKDAIVKAGAES